MKKNFDFTAEELMELEALEVRGGRDGGGVFIQTGCINEAKGCGAGVTQSACINKVDGCGGSLVGAHLECLQKPQTGCAVVNSGC